MPGTARRSSPKLRSGATAITSLEMTLTAAGESMMLVRRPRLGVTTIVSRGVWRPDDAGVAGVAAGVGSWLVASLLGGSSAGTLEESRHNPSARAPARTWPPDVTPAIGAP